MKLICHALVDSGLALKRCGRVREIKDGTDNIEVRMCDECYEASLKLLEEIESRLENKYGARVI